LLLFFCAKRKVYLKNLNYFQKFKLINTPYLKINFVIENFKGNFL